jgi:hypothetical protein
MSTSSAALRRTPAAVVAALEMDRSRREMYVEGPGDRRFLAWLAGPRRDPNALIHEIDIVDLPGESGAKTRILALAVVAGSNPRIRFFVDCDHDRVLGRTPPNGVIETDFRDREGYVLNDQCIDKALLHGVGVDAPDAHTVLAQVLPAARELAILRLVSEQNELKLPFKTLTISTGVTIRNGHLVFDLGRLLRNLVSRSIGQARLDEVQSLLEKATVDTKEAEDLQLVHGKDTFALIAEIFLKLKVPRIATPAILWLTFERSMVGRYPNLSSAVSFLSRRDEPVAV